MSRLTDHKTGSDCIDGNKTPTGSQVVAGNNTVDRNAILDDDGANSKYYMDVVIPVGTNAFLVYGRATPDNYDTELKLKQTNGILQATGLTSTVGTTPGGISFAPLPMVSSTTIGHAAGWTDSSETSITTGDNIIVYLNTIFNENWANQTDYPVLYGLYELVQNMKAGSSASVLAFVQEIYDALKPSSSIDYVETVLKAILVKNLVEGDLPSTLPDTVTLPDNCNGYPGDIGLPDGAAVIEWDDSNADDMHFAAVTSKNNLGAMNVDVKNYVFPTELYYRANSRIHTSEVELTDVNTQASAIFNREKWDESADNSSVLEQKVGTGENAVDLFTPNGIVLNTTTIVAITDPLQYAVGRLDVRLEAKSTGSNPTTVTKLVDADGNEFKVADLPITGILIGQQSPVDYKFHSKWTKDTDPLYTIYDGKITAMINPDANVYTHTLALETAANQSVNVAIELRNHDTDKRSIIANSDNLAYIIPYGCKFYLVGELKLSDATPPENLASNAEDKIIAQDHVTQVTFTVSDLTKAYYVIPDFSTTPLELSLGVIDWKLSTPINVELDNQ